MKRVLSGVWLAVCLATGPSYAAEFVGVGASAELPVSARILDFKTTQSLCSSDIPPDWCPAHLLRGDSDSSDARDGFMPSEEQAFTFSASAANPVDVNFSVVME